MTKKIELLDCTLRDGAYIVDAKFGTPAIKGIIRKMQDANAEIIECGWLKDSPHQEGTTFYHVPADLEQYITEKSPYSKYVVMIDWNRYNLDFLPQNDGKSIDAVRVVFPKDRVSEGMQLGKIIKSKGYDVFFQASNTLGYSDDELLALAEAVNEQKPVALSVVDTFGAMFTEDLEHIVRILDDKLDKDIKLGFHSHNNQQLSFALSMRFVELLKESERGCIVDASLCGMGRGAGNATTELVASYLNRKQQGNYDMNDVMDAIDMYMTYFQNNYSWGYSTPYFIAGMYCTHVNNIAYLLKNHRTNAKDMRNVIESLQLEDRLKYDYDILEQRYLDYQDKGIDDNQAIEHLTAALRNRKVLLLLPGKSVKEKSDVIKQYILDNSPIVISVNDIFEEYNADFAFFSNKLRYNYEKNIDADRFDSIKRIIVSRIKTHADDSEILVNFNFLVKRGWEHFDNAGIMCLRLLNKLHVENVALAGFDGFGSVHGDNYANPEQPHINPGKDWDDLNAEIKDMLVDFRTSTAGSMNIEFITPSKYE